MKPKLRSGAEIGAQALSSNWGTLRWLTESNGRSAPHLTVGRVVIRRGRHNPEHFHTTCDEVLYMLSGTVRHSIGDNVAILRAGDVLEIPRGVHHRALNIGTEDADMVVVYNSAERDFHLTGVMDALVASPVCFPDDDLDTVLERFASMGFTHFEAFTSWVSSRLDVHAPVERYLNVAHRHGIAFQSVHLPKISADAPESCDEARDAIDFAADLGAAIVIYKADTHDGYVRNAAAMLDRAEARDVTLVLQNHAGTVLTTPDDVQRVLDAVGDERMKVLLEVGHYVKAGVRWQDAFGRLEDRIAYCHIKDLHDGKSVAYGTGEVDFADLFERMNAREYGNGFVVELEAREFDGDHRAVERVLRTSVAYLKDAVVI